MGKEKAGFRKISDKSVLEKTGKSWEEWYKILDEWGMKENEHTLTAKYLREHYGAGPWWAQVVTIRYEWERGLRK